MVNIKRKMKKILATFLVVSIFITQNLTYLSPVFANEISETINNMEETEGSHPQEGSFGETHHYINKEDKT